MKWAIFMGAAAFPDLDQLFKEQQTELYKLTEEEQVEHRAHFERIAKERGEDELVANIKEIFEDSFPAINSMLLAQVGATDKAWESGDQEHFKGWAVHDLKKIMGSPSKKEDYMELEYHHPTVQADLPASFDSRTKWANCPTIAQIRDQASCGSCWAFGSTEAFNDRLCIASGGKFTTELSAQDTTSCCSFFHCFSMGCSGGQPGRAWKWLVGYGVVSGGDNPDTGKSDTCWPYEIPMCAHHVQSSKYPACKEGGSTPSCKSECVNKDFPKKFADDVHTGGKSGKAYSLSSVDEIKQSIYEKGPVTGGFTVYSDFPTYKSGVYEHKTGSELGGHAIKIYGWGTDNGTDYWMVANSWNTEWGDKGSFKIKMGDSGINDMVSAGDVEAVVDQYMVI